ncbi:MAG: hypothetical protein AABY14_00500 [Nanoarchaeota archaeon]
MIETKIKNPTLMRLFYILIVLIIVFSAYRLKPVITGLFTIDDRFTYNRSVGLEFRENSNYTWTLEQPWNLKSIRLSGNYLPMSYTRVYIENNNLTYLIFDSSKSIGSLGDISSYVIEQKLSEAISPSLFPKDKNNKSILANLEYKSDTEYDIDNNGIELISGVIDFDIKTDSNTEFDYNNLCTRWGIYSLENQTMSIVCNGNVICCNYIGLKPLRDEWNSSFYLTYELYGATYNNLISAQVIYVEYNLSIEKPFAEISYSNWTKLLAKFHPNQIEFIDVCQDTCMIQGFNGSEYRLIIKVNGTFFLDKIRYTIRDQEINKTPKNLSMNTSILEINFTEDIKEVKLKQYNAVINEPVKWTKSVALNEEIENLSIDLPKEAFNLTVNEIIEGKNKEIPEDKIDIRVNETEKSLIEYELEKKLGLIEKELKETLDDRKLELEQQLKNYKSELKRIKNTQKTNRIRQDSLLTSTGSAILDIKEETQIIPNETYATIIINEPVSDVVVEYETPAPKAIETELGVGRKQIVISSDLYYENILSYSYVDNVPKDAIKLYWYVNQEDYERYFKQDNYSVTEHSSLYKADITNNPLFNTAFIDLDNNGLIDLIEWNTPHTSNQKFEISIEIEPQNISNIKKSELNESALIVYNKARAEKELRIVESLFNNIPECQWMRESLIEARKSFEKKDFDKAISLVKVAMERCKRLIPEIRRIEIQSPISTLKLWIAYIAVLAITLILIYLVHKKIDEVSIILQKINKARDKLLSVDLESAKWIYLEILRMYNLLPSKKKWLVYKEVKKLYDDRKSAELRYFR